MDRLDRKRVIQEMIEDRDAQSFGYDRYRTESMYDSLNRLDESLHMLMRRRHSQTYRIKQREANGDRRWGYI